ncbi:MAG: dephospho-CoA kinase [Pseudomonadota bacterium]
MITIGLTGSIGMGKSTTAKLFAEEGAAVWDADAAVHRLYAPGGKGVAPVLQAFPSCGSKEKGIDRAALAAATLGRPEALKTLEAIVHPLVREDQGGFLDQAHKDGTAFAVLDIPLLVEGGLANLFDAVVVVTADLSVRRARVLERPGMDEAKLDHILARQASEDERLGVADYIIRTDQDLEAARGRVRAVLSDLRVQHDLDKSGKQR